MIEHKQFIRNRIAELKNELGVSSKTMSYELGHSHAYISNILSGSKMPSLEGLIEIIDYFDISMSVFFDDKITVPKMTDKLVEDICSLSAENKILLQRIVEVMKQQN